MPARVRHLFLLCVACCSLLVGCSKPAPVSGPWAAQIETDRRQATSDFERGVLADGKVQRSEYDEAVHRYESCVQQHGIMMEAQVQADGSYNYQTPGQMTPQTDAVMTSCGRGTTVLLEPLYIGMLQNPQHVDRFSAMASCMIRHHKAPTGFTGAQLKDILVRATDAEHLPAGSPIDGADPVVQSCFDPPYR